MAYSKEKKFRPGPSEKMSFRSLLEPLLVIFNKATNEVLPNKEYYISYSIPGGVFGYYKDFEISNDDLKKIKNRIKSLIHENLDFSQEILPNEKVLRYFDINNRPDILELLYSNPTDLDQGMHIAHLDNYGELFFNHINEHYDRLDNLQLFKYSHGFFLIADTDFYLRVMPERLEVSKYLKRFEESEKSMRQMGIENLANLNEVIEKGHLP
ncbi:MAG: hypothetical protein ACOCXH_11785, partial [Cyclobacteriaceae bacterium]